MRHRDPLRVHQRCTAPTAGGQLTGQEIVGAYVVAKRAIAARLRRWAASTNLRPGRWRRLKNAVMSALVSAGLVTHSYLLTTRGCRTGRARKNPVLVVGHDGRRWLVAQYGAVSWVHNARAAGQVRLARRRDTRAYAIREVDPPEVGPVLQQYVQVASATRQYFQADQ